MKYLLCLLLLLQTATPPEDYPGQSNHAAPPAGWMCEPQNYELSVPPEHACTCERMCDSETGKVIEDKRCKVWCHPDACKCIISNKTACK